MMELPLRERKSPKQICFTVPDQWHKEIKQRATEHNISVKAWVLMAILEQVKKEKELE